MRQKKLLGAVLAAAGMVTAGSASAIAITPTLDATTLGNALLGGGGAGIDLTSVSVSVSGQTETVPDGPTFVSAGTFTNDANTYGIGPGVVISSGNVNDYETGPNTSPSTTTVYGVPASPAQEALLDPITGGLLDHNDVTQIDITFDMLPGFDTVFFNVTFGSEEYDEFVGSPFIDAFGLYVNGTNIAQVNGDPVNIDHPDMLFLGGTELDGILGGADGDFGPYVHTFGQLVGDGSTGNSLTFIIADSGDAALDSTVYISQLGGSEPPPPPNGVPVPAPLTLLSLGLVALAARQRR